MRPLADAAAINDEGGIRRQVMLEGKDEIDGVRAARLPLAHG